jgi:thiamine-phosphate pyrophosphorylase
MTFPRLYAIADAALLQSRGLGLGAFAADLRAGGVTLLQYRNKGGSVREILSAMQSLRPLRSAENFRLILNDRADLALLADADGVHVGQQDLAPADARRIVGPARWVGVSTHSPAQLEEADATDCNYIAYGPIFATASKQNPDPVVGLAGLQQARRRTRKPLVAIGGITLANARAVLDAGADSIAVISALLPPERSPRQAAEDFLAILR